jgi:hypothetical protein
MKQADFFDDSEHWRHSGGLIEYPLLHSAARRTAPNSGLSGLSSLRRFAPRSGWRRAGYAGSTCEFLAQLEDEFAFLLMKRERVFSIDRQPRQPAGEIEQFVHFVTRWLEWLPAASEQQRRRAANGAEFWFIGPLFAAPVRATIRMAT